MAKKNTLREVKSMGNSKGKAGNQVEPKNLTTTTETNRWEAWQCLGTNSPENWHQVWEGSFADCFEELQESIDCELGESILTGEVIEKLEIEYQHKPELIPQVMEQMLKPTRDKVKAQCLENKECEGQNWYIAQSPSKFKRQSGYYPFSFSTDWEGWEIDETGQGQLVVDGSLEECLQEMMFYFTLDIDKKAEAEIKYMDTQTAFGYKNVLRSQMLAKAKSTCLAKGEYKGSFWTIRSILTREQCEWIAKNGKP